MAAVDDIKVNGDRTFNIISFIIFAQSLFLLIRESLLSAIKWDRAEAISNKFILSTSVKPVRFIDDIYLKKVKTRVSQSLILNKNSDQPKA
jgi:hypothetical protein